ncbi:ATP-binding cassette domain-containing protein [Nocardioides carbamazepini]|uniref:ABC transporter ATP-binding protein n=1 Tax=Nocardioides carbamazepini TaxID=2854259 RepID=UPI00214A21BF|nr:ATP-binding cassette domain-containing protein [Nocardioides carbamazepini]MCR1784902.1 ATP-binding cassette domain-containing protein [Nocardioides carbamazepini]
MTALLEVRGVTKSYGGVEVLRGVDLVVTPGEIHGLIGANGAGKSTLIDILCGQNRQDAGEIVLRDRTLTGSPGRRSRSGLARTFQQPQVSAALTVAENISLGLAGQELAGLPRILGRLARDILTPHRSVDPRVVAAAEAVGLDRLDRLVGSLSFGEMRLVEVARALVGSPSLMLLDEPFPGVGDRGLDATLAALRRLRAAEHSVLLVDHNVDVVLGLVDRVSLLVKGVIAFVGTPAECQRSEVFRSVYLGERVR